MKAVFYLSTCNTCKKIMDDFNIKKHKFELRDMKQKHVSESELDELKSLVGSYSELFNRRSQKYRKMNIKAQEDKLSDDDFRELILDEYTFLKRPIFVDGKKIAIGTSSKAMHQVSEMLGK